MAKAGGTLGMAAIHIEGRNCAPTRIRHEPFLLRALAAWLVVLLLCFICQPDGMARESATPDIAMPTAPDIVALERFVQTQMVVQGIAGLALAVTHNGQIVMLRGYGQASDGVPVSAHTQFRIASLSKSFTAVAVLQLVEAGRVELDRPVSHYVPDFTCATNSGNAAITVRQLLHHSSGLADAGFIDGLAGQQQTLAARVASMRCTRQIAPPGTTFHYFDPNYQLLARLVELASGQGFDTYLQSHIFAPLAMHDSISVPTAQVAHLAPYLAQGHIVLYGRPRAMPELSGFLAGSGGVVSSAADMAQYLIAQSGDGAFGARQLLAPRSIRLMQTPAPGVTGNYGMGWVSGNVDGVRTLEHDGVLSTFYAEAVLLPDTGYGFVLLYNQYGFNSTFTTFPLLKRGMIAILTGRVAERASVSPATLGNGLALLTLLAAGLSLFSLWRLPRWQVRTSGHAWWKAVPGLLWHFMPLMVLLALPHLLAIASGRYFEYRMLARAMPELIILLASCGATGSINAFCRIVCIHRQTGIRHCKKDGLE